MTDAQLTVLREEVEALEEGPGHGTVEVVVKDGKVMDLVIHKRKRIS